MKKGWQTKTIGDVCEFQRGLTYAKGDEVDVSDNVVLRATNIDLATNLLIFDELKYISDKVVVPESKKVKKGSLMICMASGSKSHLGKVAFIDDDYGYAFGGFMGMLTPLNGLLPKYLFHLMTSEDYKDFIGALSDGANINNLTFDKLKVFPVPAPPLAEQQRIVGLLDEAFEGLATAKANAEKNLQNACALFESHLQSVFTQRGPGWVEKRLEDVCGLQNGFAFKSSTFKPSGAPILRISNIQDGRVDAGNRLVFFDPKDYRENLDRYRIVEDDLLIAMSGATTGKLGFNTESTVYYLNQRVGKFEPSEKLNKRFLYHFLSTKVEENLRISAGAAQPNLSTEQIKGFVLPLPSVDEQERIVEALETLSEETQHLARLYERKLALLEALKKSLLHQAFTGEL
ncbi:MAG: restriction endonuclease subunit S [Chthoniobacter sp.]|nr:restriction endonuclease subunit S [Chthoniobacter sp.]